TERPGVEPLDPIPERLLPQWHLAIHFGSKLIRALIERPTAGRRLVRKIECRADAQISASPAVDKMMQATRAASFPVIFEVVGIAGHRNPDALVCQELVERCKFFISLCGITAARKARMTDDRHDELAPATFKCTLDPRALSVVHRAQDARIYCNQRKVVGL